MDYLQHWGLEGMKWGTRRWQYPDGRFNEEGKERYFGSKIKKIEENNSRIKEKRDTSERYRMKSLINKKPFYKKPISKYDEFMFNLNNSSANAIEKENLKLKDKFINNLRKIKTDDEDTIQYRKLGEMFQKDINNYMNSLLSENGRNETYKKLLYDNKNNNNNNDKNKEKNELNKVLKNIQKNVTAQLKKATSEVNKKSDKKSGIDEDKLKKYIDEYLEEHLDEYID